jgi:predicted small metal-binding protein
MLEPNSFNNILESIQALTSLFAMALSVFAIIRSSKQKQNTDIKESFQVQSQKIEELSNKLQAHAEEDIAVQAELRADLKNNIKLAERLDEKLDKIMERI